MISQHCFARFFLCNFASLVALLRSLILGAVVLGYRLFFFVSVRILRILFVSLQKNLNDIYIMALEIRTIPTLRGKEAKRFVKLAEDAEKKPKSQDFSKQIEITQKILKEAGML